MSFDAVDAWLMFYLWLRAKGHNDQALIALMLGFLSALVPLFRRLLA